MIEHGAGINNNSTACLYIFGGRATPSAAGVIVSYQPILPV